MRAASTGIVPPEWQKINRMSGQRENVPFTRKLVMARVVSKTNSITLDGIPGIRFAQQPGSVGWTKTMALERFKSVFDLRKAAVHIRQGDCGKYAKPAWIILG